LIRNVLLGAGALLMAGTAYGAEATDIEALRTALADRFPAVASAEITPTPVHGLFQLSTGARIYYVFADGRHLLSGRLVDLETREDLTERALGDERAELMSSVSDGQTIVFEPPGQTRHTLTVFTDIDCPYCRKLHTEMGMLNDYGIRVRYMLYPRAGVPSTSYDKAVSVWCAEDQREAMNRAKAGEMPPKRECDTPIAGHMALARELGLTGTPFTVTDTGRIVSGYMPAKSLYESLEANKEGRR
jgi:thiol:disulfide interchange protein DsbC